VCDLTRSTVMAKYALKKINNEYLHVEAQ